MIEGSATVQRPRPPAFSVALDDAPWGNVLVHQPDAGEALELQRILGIAGYRVIGPVASATEVERSLERDEIDCAVIDARAGFELGALLDERAIPFVVICGDAACAVMWRAAGRRLVPRPYRAAEVLRAIHQAVRHRAKAAPSSGGRLEF